MEQTGRRKLFAILMADVVEYGRHMGEDEAATIRTLAANLMADVADYGQLMGGDDAPAATFGGMRHTGLAAGLTVTFVPFHQP